MSNQQQYRRRSNYNNNNSPKQPYKYCRNECGRFIYFDENQLTTNGKWKPLDYETQEPHDCPRKDSSPNYDPSMEAIPENEAIRPAVRQKTVTVKKTSPMVEAKVDGIQAGMDTNGILIELREHRKNGELILDKLNDIGRYLETIAAVLKPGPQPILENLQEEYQKSVKTITSAQPQMSEEELAEIQKGLDEKQQQEKL